MPIATLENFGGVHQRKTMQDNLVRRSTNIIFENGRAVGRNGIEKLLGITSALATGIIGFAEFKLQ